MAPKSKLSPGQSTLQWTRKSSVKLVAVAPKASASSSSAPNLVQSSLLGIFKPQTEVLVDNEKLDNEKLDNEELDNQELDTGKGEELDNEKLEHEEGDGEACEVDDDRAQGGGEDEVGEGEGERPTQH